MIATNQFIGEVHGETENISIITKRDLKFNNFLLIILQLYNSLVSFFKLIPSFIFY